MKLLNEGSIEKQSLSKFYKSVRQFFTSAMDYLIMWCPLGEDILGHAVWIDFERKLDVTFDSVEYFVGCFPSILGDINRDNLNEQFLQYQFMSINDLPENLKEACHYTDDDHLCRSYALWSYLRSVNKPGTKVPQFDLLFRVAVTILTIPHSNASEKGYFHTFPNVSTQQEFTSS